MGPLGLGKGVVFSRELSVFWLLLFTLGFLIPSIYQDWRQKPETAYLVMIKSITRNVNYVQSLSGDKCICQ